MSIKKNATTHEALTPAGAAADNSAKALRRKGFTLILLRVLGSNGRGTTLG